MHLYQHCYSPLQVVLLSLEILCFRYADMQTGMEMAAEAKEAGVDSVTMVHSKDFVTNTPEQGKIPLQRLKKIGVDVLLNSKAEHIEDRTYQVAGEQRTFDVVYKCFGFSTVHAALVTPLGDVLTPTGAVAVNESFQVWYPYTHAQVLSQFFCMAHLHRRIACTILYVP